MNYVTPSGEWEGKELTQDLHEFNMQGAKGETALIVTFVTVPRNITFPHCNGTSIEYLLSGVFSEVRTDGSNEEIFQWAAADHVDPQDSLVCPGDPCE